jgi:AraC-like DNA-binding protein
VPDLFFFVKDRHGRFITASAAVVQRLGRSNVREIVGRKDEDFYPPEIADQFARDDQQVIESGKPLLRRVELAYDGQRLLDWFVTSKLPVFGRKGEVIGIMGVTMGYNDRRAAIGPFLRAARAVEFIRAHYREKLSLAQIARAGGHSTRQLNRVFNEAFNMSPNEFVLRTRVKAASEALLHTDASLSEIAGEFGFYDQSVFTTQFRMRTGMTPAAFRQKYSR